MSRPWWEIHHLPTHNMIADFPTLRQAREFVASQRGHDAAEFSILRGQETADGYKVKKVPV